MDKNEIQKKIIEIISIILKDKVNVNSSRQVHENWDSLKHLEILFAIEDEFQVNFLEDSLDKLDSIENISKEILTLVDGT